MKISAIAKQSQFDPDTRQHTATLPKHSGDKLITAYNDADILIVGSRDALTIGSCAKTMTHTHDGKRVVMPFDVYARLEEAFGAFNPDTRTTWQRLGWYPITYTVTSIHETQTCWVITFAIQDESKIP